MSLALAPALKPTRALALIRVSKDREDLTSPENQRWAIETWATTNGVTVVDWIEGIDESGSNKRSAWWPRLFGAVERLEAGEVDTILVWKFSRTARQRLKWAMALDRIDTVNGHLISVTEPTDASPAGKLHRGMMGEFNAYQAELIGETWREAHARRRRAGLPATGGPRFGYLIDENGQYQPDPESAPVLVQMYQWYLSGLGGSAIVHRAYKMGVRSRRGGSWTIQGLVAMLDSGFAAGLLSRTRPDRSKGIVPPWEREYLDGAHEAIIPRDMWEAYLAERRRRHRQKRPRARRYLLVGMIFCGDCGGPMRGRVSYDVPGYACTWAYQRAGMPKVSIVTSTPDRAVEEWLFTLSDEIDARADGLRQTEKRRDERSFRERSLRRQIERASERIQRLTMRLADETITPEIYRTAVTDIEHERSEAESALARLVGNPVEENALATLPRGLRDVWGNLSIERRAEIIRPLIARVEIAPAKRRGDTTERVKIIPTWEADTYS